MKTQAGVSISVLAAFVLGAELTGAAEPGNRNPAVSLRNCDSFVADLPIPRGCAEEPVLRGSGDCCGNPLHRAGHPECLHRLAIPSNGTRYGGYLVGGGLPWFGGAPCPTHDGTWGWDYFGVWSLKRVRLNWGHAPRSQGGSGAYRTDGPKVFHH